MRDTDENIAGALPASEDIAAVRAEATRLASEAGALLLDYFSGPLDIRFKRDGDKDPVTEADGAAERQLREGILARFPDHAVLGEESDDVAGNAESPYLWVLDPLDGTTNFMNGMALWGVSIGVLYRYRPIAGAIWLPGGLAPGPVVVHAAVGMGASCDDTPIDRSARESVLARIGAVPGGAPSARQRPPDGVRLGDRRVLGSVAVEAAMVAAGVLQYAVFARPKVWDIAAGAIIVQEAGGATLIGGRNDWSDTLRFEPPPPTEGSPGPPASLRRWVAPVIVGDTGIVPHLAQRMTPRRSVLSRLLGRR